MGPPRSCACPTNIVLYATPDILVLLHNNQESNDKEDHAGHLNILKNLSPANVFIAGKKAREDLYYAYSQIWSKYILYYTRCDLTMDSDKLPVISAITRYIGTILDLEEQYLAGLWKRYLHLHLLWSSRARNRAVRLDNGSPTWSWASIKGPVYDFRLRDGHQKHTSLMNIESVRISYPPGLLQDIYGQVTGGELDVLVERQCPIAPTSTSSTFCPSSDS